MKRITRIIRPIICIVVLLVAMTTAVRGCYQRETEPIDIPGTSAPQPCHGVGILRSGFRQLCLPVHRGDNFARERR